MFVVPGTGVGRAGEGDCARVTSTSMNSDFLILLPVLLFSVVVHEVAHAWVALREGDDTAQKLGRITLNPVSHLDVVGSVVVPL